MTDAKELEDVLPAPEPAKMQEGFALMQQQFEQMMMLMKTDRAQNNARFDSLTTQNDLMQDELQASLKKDVRTGSMGRRLSLEGTPSKANVRRSSAFFTAIDASIKAPKALLNGDVFAKMNFCGKPHESLKEHLIKFEYHARNQPEQFWCDLLQLTFNKTISDAIIAEGLIQ